MNSYTEYQATLEQNRDQLEVLLRKSDDTTSYFPNRLVGFLSRVGQTVMNWLTAGTMPRVSRTMQGELEVWKVFDPISERTLYFDDENALRVWMDTRYYE